MRNGVNWGSDQIHGFDWGSGYFNSIDFVAESKRCDVKIPWETSRFQYLTWLAEGYSLDPANGGQYRDAFREIMRDWMEANRPGFGVNWTVSMEVAIRASNLVLALAVFADDLDKSFLRSMVNLLHTHAIYIRRFPEFSDVAGNHYLSNLMGLVVLDTMLKSGKKTGAASTVRAFFDEADAQFELDGCHLERAPIYHRLSMDMVALVCVFAKRGGQDMAKGISILKRAATFCHMISDQKARLPIIGDSDSGHILWFGEDARDYRGVENILRFLDQNQYAWEYADSNMTWHLAIAGIDQADIMAPAAKCPNPMPSVADRSGFIAARTSEIDCVMRVGEQGLKQRASHDHDDALSIWCSHCGEDFIIEAGCHSYTLDPEIRATSIGSQAHNLIQPVNENRYSGKAGSIIHTAVGAPTACKWTVSEGTDTLTLNARIPAAQDPAQPRPKTPPSSSFFVLISAHAAQSSVALKTQAFDNESHFESVAFQSSSLVLRHKGNRDQIGSLGLSPQVACRR